MKWAEIFASVTLFLIGLCSLYLFFYLHNSQEVKGYINEVNNSNTTAGLRLFVIYGIAKLVSIILGLGIPISVIYKVVQRTKKASH